MNLQSVCFVLQHWRLCCCFVLGCWKYAVPFFLCPMQCRQKRAEAIGKLKGTVCLRCLRYLPFRTSYGKAPFVFVFFCLEHDVPFACVLCHWAYRSCRGLDGSLSNTTGIRLSECQEPRLQDSSTIASMDSSAIFFVWRMGSIFLRFEITNFPLTWLLPMHCHESS